MHSIFDEFDNLFFGFGRPVSIRFNTPYTKDIQPASPWSKDENGYHMVARVVGINPDDLKVTLEDYGLCIDGESEYDGNIYTQHIELPISKDLLANITDITYEVKNGLCKVSIVVKEPEYKKVNVKMIK